MKLKSIASLISIILLSGCALNKMPKNTPSEYEFNEIERRVVQEWVDREKPIKYINSNVSFGIERRNIVPQNIRDIPLKNIGLNNKGTIRQLADLLKVHNINIFIPDPVVAETEFYIKSFTGSLGALLDIIEQGYNLSFNYSGGKNIILRDKSIFVAPVPQDEDSAKDLVESIKTLGAEGASFSLSGGFMIYKATNDSHQGIKEYLENYYKNFAVIKLQAAIITVNLENEKNEGFDWGLLQAVLGNSTLIDLASSGGSGVVTGIIDEVTGLPVNGGSQTPERTNGEALSITNEKLRVAYLSGNKDIKAAFNLLNTYGATNATQSIFLETISGKELKLVSGKEVPYTSNINSNVVGNQTGNVSSLSGFQSQKEEEGLEVTFKPYFNYNKNTVTLAIDLQLKSIIGFAEINSGNGNGTVEQPITQKQEFNSVVEIRPGSAHLIGGITFTLDSDNRTNLNFLNLLPTASKNKKVSKNALFILLRPTVTIYHESLAAKYGEE